MAPVGNNQKPAYKQIITRRPEVLARRTLRQKLSWQLTEVLRISTPLYPATTRQSASTLFIARLTRPLGGPPDPDGRRAPVRQQGRVRKVKAFGTSDQQLFLDLHAAEQHELVCRASALFSSCACAAADTSAAAVAAALLGQTAALLELVRLLQANPTLLPLPGTSPPDQSQSVTPEPKPAPATLAARPPEVQLLLAQAGILPLLPALAASSANPP